MLLIPKYFSLCKEPTIYLVRLFLGLAIAQLLRGSSSTFRVAARMFRSIAKE